MQANEKPGEPGQTQLQNIQSISTNDERGLLLKQMIFYKDTSVTLVPTEFVSAFVAELRQLAQDYNCVAMLELELPQTISCFGD